MLCKCFPPSSCIGRDEGYLKLCVVLIMGFSHLLVELKPWSFPDAAMKRRLLARKLAVNAYGFLFWDLL